MNEMSVKHTLEREGHPGVVVLAGDPPTVISGSGWGKELFKCSSQQATGARSTAALSAPPGRPQGCPGQRPPPAQQHWGWPSRRVNSVHL